MREQWVDIREFEGLYEVSNTGRVRSKNRWSYRQGERYQKIKGRDLKLWKDTRGYSQVYLCKNGARKVASVHRLVALHFIGAPPADKPTVNHINGVLSDNNVSNLEWLSQKENNRHAFNTGLMDSVLGENNHITKLTKSKVKEIRDFREKTGLSYKKIGDIYGVSGSTIRSLVLRKHWKHV